MLDTIERRPMESHSETYKQANQTFTMPCPKAEFLFKPRSGRVTRSKPWFTVSLPDQNVTQGVHRHGPQNPGSYAECMSPCYRAGFLAHSMFLGGNLLDQNFLRLCISTLPPFAFW